jgi:flagellar hook assembly protein FlgD
LPEEIQVNLSIYTVDGKLIKTLVNGTQASGRKISTWNGTNSRGEVVGSGVYFYSLKANDEVKTRKMIFLK